MEKGNNSPERNNKKVRSNGNNSTIKKTAVTKKRLSAASGQETKDGKVQIKKSSSSESVRSNNKSVGKRHNNKADNKEKIENRNGDNKKYINKPSHDRKVTVEKNLSYHDGKIIAPSQENKKNGHKNVKKSEKCRTKVNKQTKTPTFLYTLLFLLSLILISGTLALSVPYIKLPVRSKSVELQYDLYGEKSKKTLKEDQIFKDGKNVYVCLTDFSERIGLNVLSDGEDIRLYTDSGDTVSTKNGSNIVIINTVQLELSGNIIVEGKNIYVPAMLFVDFAEGIEITYNQSTGKMYINTIVDDEKSTSIVTVFEDFAFKPHKIDEHPAIEQENIN